MRVHYEHGQHSKKYYQNILLNNLIPWYRYIDDFIACFQEINRQFTTFLNSIQESIFTIKIKQDSKIDLSDLAITNSFSKQEF